LQHDLLQEVHYNSYSICIKEQLTSKNKKFLYLCVAAPAAKPTSTLLANPLYKPNGTGAWLA
jgi:hypothetical protein